MFLFALQVARTGQGERGERWQMLWSVRLLSCQLAFVGGRRVGRGALTCSLSPSEAPFRVLLVLPPSPSTKPTGFWGAVPHRRLGQRHRCSVLSLPSQSQEEHGRISQEDDGAVLSQAVPCKEPESRTCSAGQ